MFQIRKAKERGATHIDWLTSYHSFSFGDYHDPEHMGFGNLRVINDDVIAPASGFGMHGHRDMEIITLVLSGALKHQDSLGNGTLILPDEVQRMSAGTGIQHSEFNASDSEAVRLLQIWILPDVRGIAPSYAQEKIPEASMHNRFCLIAAPSGGLISIHQNMNLYRAKIDAGETVSYDVAADRKIWLQMADGHVVASGEELRVGDALSTHGETVTINLQAKTKSDVLIFDQQV